MAADRSIALFAGTSHPELAQQIAKELGIRLGKIRIETFPDEEIGIQILENVRGKDVFVLQTIARHPNPYLIEAIEESAIEKMFVTNPFSKGLS